MVQTQVRLDQAVAAVVALGDILMVIRGSIGPLAVAAV
jgi:hypothetical protein